MSAQTELSYTQRAEDAAAFLDAVRTAMDNAEMVLLAGKSDITKEADLRRAHAMLLVAARNLNFCEIQVGALLEDIKREKLPQAPPVVKN